MKLRTNFINIAAALTLVTLLIFNSSLNQFLVGTLFGATALYLSLQVSKFGLKNAFFGKTEPRRVNVSRLIC